MGDLSFITNITILIWASVVFIKDLMKIRKILYTPVRTKEISELSAEELKNESLHLASKPYLLFILGLRIVIGTFFIVMSIVFMLK